MMFKYWFLKVHGWLAVIFAVPLAILVFTGLVLSVEPIFQKVGIEAGTLTTDEVVGYLRKYDPEGKARALTHRSYEDSLIIGGAGPDGEVEIDLVTRAQANDDGGWYLSDYMGKMRRLHEHVTVANIELTVISTYVMLVLIVLGIAMGLPRIRNNMAGWHKATSWFLLPLLIASPLTGVFMAAGVSLNFSPSPPAARAAALPIIEAVQIIGKTQDLSNLIWLRQRGGRLMARMWDGNEARAYAVTAEGLKPTDRNIARQIHEGNFAGVWSGVMNVVISLALMLLMGTGLWLFATKQLRKFQNKRSRAAREAGVAAE